MPPLYEYTPMGIRPIQTTSFAAERIRERVRIQTHLRDQIGALVFRSMVFAMHATRAQAGYVA